MGAAKICRFGGQLDDLAEIHHGDTVRHVLDDGEVVADEQQGQPQLPLQILQQIDDLRLYRDVERRHCLVADDEVGLGGQARGRCRCAGVGRRRTRAASG